MSLFACPGLSAVRMLKTWRTVSVGVLMKIRSWQKRSCCLRPSCVDFAKKLKISLSTLKSVIRRGVRRRVAKEDVRKRVKTQHFTVAQRCYDALSSAEKRKTSPRSVRRWTLPKRESERLRRRCKIRNNRVKPHEYEKYDNSQNSLYWASQKYW